MRSGPCFRVSVEANDNSEERDARRFNFDGSILGWGLEHGPVEEMDDTWWVALAFATHRKSEKGPICPYVVDVQAIGVFRFDPSVKEGWREEFLVECGAGLIFSAIREMVSNVTSRSAASPLLLPTVSFKGALAESRRTERSSRQKNLSLHRLPQTEQRQMNQPKTNEHYYHRPWLVR